MDTQISERLLRHPDLGSTSSRRSYQVAEKVTPSKEFRALHQPSAGGSPGTEDAFHRIQAREFQDMKRTYDLHGGLDHADEIVWRVERRLAQPISAVARWIVDRAIVALVWQSQILVPRFQFTGADMQIRPVVVGAIAELGVVFDEWEIARWFTQPSVWLSDKPPVELVGVDDEAVLHAARADRFVAQG